MLFTPLTCYSTGFPTDQLFIDLHGHTPGQEPMSPQRALAGLLTAIGVDASYLPQSLEDRAGLWRDRMAGQRALLVLDNAAGTDQVAPLLPGGESCLVLVTSRRHLGDLPGVAVPMLLEAMPPDQARTMFLLLAPRAAEPAAALELVRLAGSLPLAISLLARVYARHPSWTLADLTRETRASLLTLVAEKDSVAAAFEVSYRYLQLPVGSGSSAAWACTRAPLLMPTPPPPWPASRCGKPPGISTPCMGRAC